MAPLLAVIMLTSSCSSSSSLEGDVKTMASYRCQLEKLMREPDSDDREAKMKKLQKEMEDFADKMEKKYEKMEDDKEMEEKADKIMKEEMEKCK